MKPNQYNENVKIFVRTNFIMVNNLMTHFLGRKNFPFETYSEGIGLYMKSKQLPVIEKCICLRILSLNSVDKFSEMYLSYSLNFTTNK